MRGKIKIIVMGILVLLLFSSLAVGFEGSNTTHKTYSLEKEKPRGGLANSPWPMFHYNLRHTGLSPYDTSGNPGKLKWRYQTYGGVFSSPAIGSDGTIYVGSNDDYLYALNPDGSLKWKYQTYGGVFSSPAIGSDGTIYVGSWDHYVYSINKGPPSPPQNLQATAGDGQVTLTWQAPSDDGGASITNYKIYRGTSSGGESYLTEVDGSTLSYTDTSVTNGQTYYYYVTAVNSAGESEESNEVSVTPQSGGNGQLSVNVDVHSTLMPRTSSKIYINVTYNGVGVSNALVSLSADHGSFYSGSGYTNSKGTYIDTYYAPLDYIGTATIHVNVNTENHGKVSRDVSVNIEGISRPILTASAGDGWIKLSWTPVNGAKWYWVYKGTSPGGENEVIEYDSTTTEANITFQISNGVTYYFYVRAWVNGVEGPASNEVSVTPNPKDNFKVSIYGPHTVSNQGPAMYTIKLLSERSETAVSGAVISILSSHGTVTPSTGTSSVSGTFTFSYTPASNYEGSDTINVHITKPALMELQKKLT